MDKYAMFTMDKYIEITTAENNEWVSRLANGTSYTRVLKVS